MRMTSRKSPRGDAGKSFSIFVVCAAILVSCSDVFADIYITASESGGKTTIEWSGSLDVSKLNYVGEVDAPASSIFPKLGLISAASGKKLDAYLLRSIQPRSFGEGAASLPVSNSGDSLLITKTVSGSEVCLCLPEGYKGGPLRGKIVFSEMSMGDLGIDRQPFAYDLGGQSIYFFPTSQSFTHTGKTGLGKILSRVLPDREKKVIKIRAFVEGDKRTTGNKGQSDSELASVEVRPVSKSGR